MHRASKLRPTVLAAVLLCTGAAACETEAVGGGPDQSNPGTFAATVDGLPWQRNANVGLGSAVAVLSPSLRQARIVAGEIATDGSRARIIGLRLNDFTGPGTYALGLAGIGSAELTGPSYAFLDVVLPSGQTLASYETGTGANVGTVTVTEWDAAARRIAGTFAFTAQAGTADSVVRVTAGQFAGQTVVSAQ